MQTPTEWTITLQFPSSAVVIACVIILTILCVQWGKLIGIPSTPLPTLAVSVAAVITTAAAELGLLVVPSPAASVALGALLGLAASGAYDHLRAAWHLALALSARLLPRGSPGGPALPQ